MTETSKLKLQLPEDNNTADIAVINANMILLDDAVSAKADLPGADAVKAAPVDGDGVLVADSADGGKPKQVLWSRVKAVLNSYFDALYALTGHTHTKSEITDFPASMPPTAHKASHKTGGSDAIAPADIGAAAASHSHDERYYKKSEMDVSLSTKLPFSGGTMTGVLTAAEDSSPATAKVRNTSLHASTTNPAAEGAIAWQYS